MSQNRLSPFGYLIEQLSPTTGKGRFSKKQIVQENQKTIFQIDNISATQHLMFRASYLA